MQNQSYVFSNTAANIKEHDISSSETVVPERDKTIVPEVALKRKLPYYINRNLEPTSVLPVFYGAHVNKQNQLTFTAKFPDEKCYTMVPARLKKGVLPMLKNTQILNNRCRNSLNLNYGYQILITKLEIIIFISLFTVHFKLQYKIIKIKKK